MNAAVEDVFGWCGSSDGLSDMGRKAVEMLRMEMCRRAVEPPCRKWSTIFFIGGGLDRYRG